MHNQVERDQMNLEMPPILKGLNVLIVGGGGGGIGRACSEALAAAGANLALVDIDKSTAEEAVQSIRDSGGSAFPVIGDVRSVEEIQRFIRESEERLGGIDGLVTIVGGVKSAGVPQVRHDEESDDAWERVFDYNLRYLFRVTREMIKVWLAQGRGGSITSIGSTADGHGSPTMASYGAAKSGVNHLAKTLAAEYGPNGIRMNVVSPGWTATAAGTKRSDDHTAKLLSTIPMRRRGTPQDIANAVTFLTSPLAGYISGQYVAVEGGQSCSTAFLLAQLDVNTSA
jgi:3-oxoacyl-[acyl-carrier protein] reductase